MGIGHESQSGTSGLVPAGMAAANSGVAATPLEGAELARDSITGRRAAAKRDALVRERNLRR